MNIKKIIKQRYTGQLIGSVIDTYTRSAGIFGGLAYIYTLTIMYYTTPVNTFMPFWLYLMLMGAGVVFVLLATFKYAMPSTYGWFNAQIWKHDNPLRKHILFIERLLKGNQVHIDMKLERIEKELAEIKSRLPERQDDILDPLLRRPVNSIVVQSDAPADK